MRRRLRRSPALSSERFCVGYFEDESALLAAVAAARRRGYSVVDVFTPYPVHGLPETIGLARSRLVWIGVGAGVLGLLCGLVLQFWTSAYDWPLLVGGQPFNSWPVFIPVTFELTVLFAGIAGLVALLIRSPLYPGRLPAVLGRVTDDRFAVVLVQEDSSLDPNEMAALLREHHAVEVLQGDEIA